MPPSLTLSKIRSLKQEALMAAVSFKMEVSTVALACIYFERLCLDTRVDKSNRRLTFAACLLLAAKINENNVRVDIQSYGGNEDEGKISRVISVIKPSKASRSMFASLLEFFAHDWSLSLKTLFAAEWGVFAVGYLEPRCTIRVLILTFLRLFLGTGFLTAHYPIPGCLSFQAYDEGFGVVAVDILRA